MKKLTFLTALILKQQQQQQQQKQQQNNLEESCAHLLETWVDSIPNRIYMAKTAVTCWVGVQGKNSDL